MKKITLSLFAFLLSLGAMAQRDFIEDKVKVLYRWHTEFPEGSKNTMFAFYDVDQDGTMECMVMDESGHKGMFWYSGVIIRFEALGTKNTDVTFWKRHIVSETFADRESAVVGMEAACPEEKLVVMKGSRIVPKVLDGTKVHKIINRLKRKPAVTWDDLDWQPLTL